MSSLLYLLLAALPNLASSRTYHQHLHNHPRPHWATDKYLEMFECNHGNGYSTVSLIDTTADHCNHLLGRFVRGIRVPKTIGQVDSRHTTTEYVVFVHDVATVEGMLARWNPRAKIHVIVCAPELRQDGGVPEIMAAAGARGMLDFVVVFVGAEQPAVLSYDVYRGEVLSVEWGGGCPELFPNKLKDIEGHTVKVAMYNNPPTLRKVDGKWMGRDYSLLELVVFALNATLEVVESPPAQDFEGVARLLTGGEADFSFQGLTQAPDLAALDTLNPHVVDGVVALVPRPAPAAPVTLLDVCDGATWAALAAVFVMLLAAARCRFAAPLASAAPTLASLFLHLFQSTMSGTLTSAGRHAAPPLRTVAELEGSRLEIVTYPRFHRFVAEMHELARRMTVVDKREMYRMIQSGDGGRGYVLPHFVAEHFVGVRRGGEPVYSVMEEVLVPAHRVFPFRKDSLYLREVEKIVLRLKEAGFMEKLYEEDRRDGENVDSVYLTLKHLRSVFVLLQLGHLLALATFLYEVVAGNKRFKVDSRISQQRQQ